MNQPTRTMGLTEAVGVGVGGIVGGGILALAGVALAASGPSAIIAFGLNGVIALLTAISFSEMASKFPESGGTYTFAKKALSVEAAFIVGWVVWFASVVAAVLYAAGFAYFASNLLSDCISLFREVPVAWLSEQSTRTTLAVISTVLIAVSLIFRSAGGGQWVNIAKVFVFGTLIVGGLWAVFKQSPTDTRSALSPFFASGFEGLLKAMGYSFIALQGFDLIAAVGGEVRDPQKNIPRAMIYSLAIALVIYLPFLFVICAVGTPPGESIQQAAEAEPAGVVALAAQQFLGRFGYWLVTVAAVLSMYSALQANLFAASRIAQAMARDRTLPKVVARTSRRYGTPVAAIVLTAGLVAALLTLIPNVSDAGAASSLIFLITFALTHWISILVRQRSHHNPPPFRSPMFPAVAVLGGGACLGLAIFQGFAVPPAGTITVLWLAVGGLMFLILFARQARLLDATNTAMDPELAKLRGRTPTVLVPVANPHNAHAMISLADALVPSRVGRLLAHTVTVAPQDWEPNEDSQAIQRSQDLLGELLRVSGRLGVRLETLTTIASDPMEEIARIAKIMHCESVLLGLSEISEHNDGSRLEALLGTLHANVVVLRAKRQWQLAQVRKIVVPIAGRGGNEYLLAAILGCLERDVHREVTYVRVIAEGSSAQDQRRAYQHVRSIVGSLGSGSTIQVVLSNDPVSTIKQHADDADLLILGVQRQGRYRKLFGDFTRQIAQQTDCPIIVISRRD